MTVPLNIWKPIDGKAYRRTQWKAFNSQFKNPIWQPLDHKSLLICSDPLQLNETEKRFIINSRRTGHIPIITSHDDVLSESDKVLSGKDFKIIEEF